MAGSEDHSDKKKYVEGNLAILGTDFVSFSVLEDDDQVTAIKHLFKWVKQSLAGVGLEGEHYRWSPAGDGGYITFTDTNASRKAIWVAIAIATKVYQPEWVPRTGNPLKLRMVLHAGPVQEHAEIGRDTNIWGVGINMTARMLSVCGPSQLLISSEYRASYLKENPPVELGLEFHRTVKHGSTLKIMNASHGDILIDNTLANALRWQVIEDRWAKTVDDFEAFMEDAMQSGNFMAALAAANVLVRMGAHERARPLLELWLKGSKDNPRHWLFGLMSEADLLRIIENSKRRTYEPDAIICQLNDPSPCCYFPISGRVKVSVPNVTGIPHRTEGSMIGEFSLWIPKLPRTATLSALDKVMLLEVPNTIVAKVMKESQQLRETVVANIKGRIIENVRGSDIFSKHSPKWIKKMTSVVGECFKIDAGETLDLKENAFVLFYGKLLLNPKNKPSLTLERGGIEPEMPIAGIVSPIGNPDGAVAEVIQESVVVAIKLKELKKLQEQSSEVAKAWNSMVGMRLGEYKELS